MMIEMMCSMVAMVVVDTTSSLNPLEEQMYSLGEVCSMQADLFLCKMKNIKNYKCLPPKQSSREGKGMDGKGMEGKGMEGNGR